MLKKMTVLAMAVGILAAMALPASAPAAWKHHDVAIQINKTTGFTGNVRFQGGLGGVECQVTSAVEFKANQTTGTAETFKPHPTSETSNCKGLGGLIGCQIHELTPQEPGWVIHTATATTITVTTTTIHSVPTGGFCPLKTISLTAGTVTFTPNQPNTVTTAALSGQLQAHQQTAGSGTVHTEEVTVSGTLTAEEPHTYSI